MGFTVRGQPSTSENTLQALLYDGQESHRSRSYSIRIVDRIGGGDAFAGALRSIRDEALTDPGVLHEAPHTAPVRRLDEVRAARQPILRWQGE